MDEPIWIPDLPDDIGNLCLWCGKPIKPNEKFCCSMHEVRFMAPISEEHMDVLKEKEDREHGFESEDGIEES